MSLRSFFRKVEGFNKRRAFQQEQDRRLALDVAACVTAEVVNIIGSANSKKGKWKQVQPKAFIDSWTGGGSTESRLDRIKRAFSTHDARLRREAARRG